MDTMKLTERLECLRSLGQRMAARTQASPAADRTARYAQLAEHLNPVVPWTSSPATLSEDVTEHLAQLVDLCQAGCSIALITASRVETDMALSLPATVPRQI